MPVTEKQLAANRRNAQKSTGPQTREGKERSRANATTHGLTAVATIYRPIRHEDPSQFAEIRADLLDDCQPVGARERYAVEMMAAAYKRIQRCEAMEAAMFSGAMDATQMEAGRAIQASEKHDDLGCAIMAGKKKYEPNFEYLERYRRSAWADYNRAVEQFRRLRKDRLETPIQELRAAKAVAGRAALTASAAAQSVEQASASPEMGSFCSPVSQPVPVLPSDLPFNPREHPEAA